jgi:hypothetical protein
MCDGAFDLLNVGNFDRHYSTRAGLIANLTTHHDALELAASLQPGYERLALLSSLAAHKTISSSN